MFSVAEQVQPLVDRQQRFESVLVAAGHVEIVGDGVRVPHQLIDILRCFELLADVPASRDQEFAFLLGRLYGTLK